MLKRNDLVLCDDRYYRVLEIVGEKYLVIDCVKRTMPVMISLPEGFETVDSDHLPMITGRRIESFEKASAERQNTAYKRFSMISGIIHVIGDKAR